MPSPPARTFAVLDLARADAHDADADVAIALLAREDETWTRVDVRRGRFPSDAFDDALAGVVVVGGRTRAVDDGRDRGARAWTIARATRRRLEEWLGRCARARVGAVDDGTTDGGRW